MNTSNGKIKPVKFNEKFVWNIMGANYASNQHNVGMAFKITDTNGTPLTLANLSSKFDVKLAITLGDDATSRGTVLEGAISPSQDANGWFTFNSDLSSFVNLSGNKIAQIGLSINPIDKTNEYKISVGELTVDWNNLPTPSSTDYIESLTSEYAIIRDTYKDYRLNAKLNSAIDSDQIDYFEYYYKRRNGKIYRCGENYQIGFGFDESSPDLYHNTFLKQLPLDADQIIIHIVNKYNPANSKYQAFNI